jgi:serine/threonine-protein kinase
MKRNNSQVSMLNAQLTGTRLGDYHVRELLGSGGMATVYKGYDPALDRNVAIKVISTTGQPSDFAARFQREARVVARLRHPNIVHIYHFGVQHDIIYMVQELLAGPTLERRIREAGQRRIAAERVHLIVAQLAGALDFAHSQSVVHRDVKPSNALYNTHGQIVLTDFGIARSPADMSRTATGPGVVMGTPGYLAPEQAISSVTLTPACDVYALGVVLFELLIGRLPFEADTPMGVVLKHLYDNPPLPSSLRADLPPALDKVVLRALSKEPAERYPSASALAQALHAAWPRGRPAASQVAARPAAESTPRARVSRPAYAGAATPPVPTPTPKARVAGAGVTPSARRTPPAQRTTPKLGATPAKDAGPARVARATPPGRAALRRAPARRSLGSLRVGLLTLDIVGALILFGARPHALAEAWRVLQPLIGQ